MHPIQVSCIVRHGNGSAWHRGFMKRLADTQLLLASATSEAGGHATRETRQLIEGFAVRPIVDEGRPAK